MVQPVSEHVSDSNTDPCLQVITRALRRLGAALVVALTLVVPVFAVSVTGLYEAQVGLANNTDAAREAATRLAMRVVLTKRSGSAQAPLLPGAESIIANAADYIEQFQILDTGDGLTLEVTFNQPTLDQAMDNANIPSWSNERPETLIWLFANLEGTWQMVAPNRVDAANVAEVVAQRAINRGLPLMWPRFDETDTAILREADSGEGTLVAIATASERYAPNAHVYFTLMGVGAGFFEAQWVLRFADGQREWRGEGTERDLLLEEAMNALADSVASRFITAQGVGSGVPVTIEVDEVTLATDYGRLIAYLEGLSAVDELAVLGATPDGLTLGLRVRGGLPEFDRLIGLGRVLEPTVGAAGRYVYLR